METSTERRKKSGEERGKMVKSCGCGSLQVCLFTKMSLSYELWKLKIVKMCFQFP